MHKKQIKSKLVIADEIVERKIKQRERIKAILKKTGIARLKRFLRR